MCGIVGYYGPQSPKDVIIDGLSQLEYRGYDSAGVAILDHGHFKQIRAEGKLTHLSQKLNTVSFDGRLGIGHTRWATHGIPSERNAHPHRVDSICLVHNGIIENYMELREELIRSGATINSDTDSELVAHLVSLEYPKVGSLEKAVRNVIPRLHGAYAIVVVSENEPENMVAFKNGPPLIFGFNDKEAIVASDVQAIVKYARNCVYLDDGEILSVKGLNYKIFNLSGQEVEKKPVYVDWTQERAEKRGYSHFMLKEIHEQPRAIAAAIEPFIDLQQLNINFKNLIRPDLPWVKKHIPANGHVDLERAVFSQIERVIIVACGSSYYSGMVGEYLIERMARIPVEIEFASEFRYRNPILGEKTLVLVISQSGETADTLAALRQAKTMGALTASICNVKNSTIDRESDIHFYMRSDVEIGVASTKSFTCTISVLNCIALYLGKMKGVLSAESEREYCRTLLDVPSEIEKVLSYASYFEEYAATFKSYRGFLYLGRGVNYPIALEGALKLKEIAYMHAEGYAAGEMKHGPIALIDSEIAVVVVAPNDDVYEKTVSNLEEVRARGAQVISFGTGQNSRLESISKYYISLPELSWNLNPIVAVVPLQLLAFHIAKSLGHDVDQPRNLAKSVTVE